MKFFSLYNMLQLTIPIIMLKPVGEWKEQVNWKIDQNSYSDNTYIWNPNNPKYLRNRGEKHTQKG